MSTSSRPTSVPGADWSASIDLQDAASKFNSAAASKFNSAAAFVESGIQEVYEDSCSICLEVFTEEEPLTMTTCNHDYHLQCILEWAQRRQECPMCWQPLSLRDPESQELLAACSHERAFHSNSVSTTSMLRSAFEDFELQHRYSTSYPEEADLERRIMQHLAVAASGISRARLVAGSSLVSSRHAVIGNSAESTTSNGRATIQAGTLVVGNNSRTSSPDMGGRGASPSNLTSAFRLSVNDSGEHEDSREDSVCATSAPASPRLNRGPVLGFLPMDGENQLSSGPSRAAGAEVVAEGFQPLRAGGGSQNWSGSNDNREGSGPQRAAEATGHVPNNGGDLSSLGDALKSRWAAASTRYRETLTKSTRSFRDRLRLRGGTVADISAKAREVGAGVVRAIERMSDPGPSSSDRANNDDNEGENTVTHSTALEGGTPDRLQSPDDSFSNPSPDPSSQVVHQGTHVRFSDGDDPQLSTAHYPYQHQAAVVSESPERGVQAGSVATFVRLNINGDDDMEEIPLKVAADPNSVTESQRSTPLAA